MSQLPQSKPLSEQVVELLEEKILAGEFSVGDQIPTENELAAMYRVSRTVIREAIKILKEKGWVETRVARGTFIVSNTSRGVGSSFNAVLRMDPAARFRHLMQVRLILEPEIAALAAAQAGPEAITIMQQAVEQMDKALEALSVEEFLKADFTFHMAMAESTGNPLIPVIMSPVIKLIRDSQEYHLVHVKGGNARSQHNHKLVMQAIEAHDPATARKYMHAHVLQVRTDVEQARGASDNPIPEETAGSVNGR